MKVTVSSSQPPADTLTVTFDDNADTVTIDGIDTDVTATDLHFKVVDSDGVGAPSVAITIADSKVTISSGSGGKNKAVISYADLKEAYDGADYSGKTKADLTDFAVHYASNGGTIEKDGQGAGALSPEITTAAPAPLYKFDLTAISSTQYELKIFANPDAWQSGTEFTDYQFDLDLGADGDFVIAADTDATFPSGILGDINSANPRAVAVGGVELSSSVALGDVLVSIKGTVAENASSIDFVINNASINNNDYPDTTEITVPLSQIGNSGGYQAAPMAIRAKKVLQLILLRTMTDRIQSLLTGWTGTESDLESSVRLYTKNSNGDMHNLTLPSAVDFKVDSSVSTKYEADINVRSMVTADTAKIGAYIDADNDFELDEGTVQKPKVVIENYDLSKDLTLSYDINGTPSDTTDDHVFNYYALGLSASISGSTVTITVKGIDAAPIVDVKQIGGNTGAGTDLFPAPGLVFTENTGVWTATADLYSFNADPSATGLKFVLNQSDANPADDPSFELKDLSFVVEPDALTVTFNDTTDMVTIGNIDPDAAVAHLTFKLVDQDSTAAQKPSVDISIPPIKVNLASGTATIAYADLKAAYEGTDFGGATKSDFTHLSVLFSRCWSKY